MRSRGSYTQSSRKASPWSSVPPTGFAQSGNHGLLSVVGARLPSPSGSRRQAITRRIRGLRRRRIVSNRLSAAASRDRYTCDLHAPGGATLIRPRCARPPSPQGSRSGAPRLQGAPFAFAPLSSDCFRKALFSLKFVGVANPCGSSDCVLFIIPLVLRACRGVRSRGAVAPREVRVRACRGLPRRRVLCGTRSRS